MIILTALKSLCKRCNTDMKEKVACETYELITASGLPLFQFCFQMVFIVEEELDDIEIEDIRNLENLSLLAFIGGERGNPKVVN